MPHAVLFSEDGGVAEHSLPTGHTQRVVGGAAWRLALGHEGELFYEEAAEDGGTLQERLLEFERVVEVATSTTHAAVITNDGRLYTWGIGDKGALGLGGSMGKSFPHLVERKAFGKAVKVACGINHTVIINALGEVYTAGSNTWGQLGVGPLSKKTPLPELRPPQMNFRCVLSLWRAKIAAIACGAYHTALLSEDGAVHTFGWGGSGALGHGSHKSLAAPAEVESLRGKRVARVACGWGHTLVTTGHETLAAGLNNYGQLGVGDTRQRASFTEVQQLQERGTVADVACGDFSSFALLAARGELLSWGAGALGFPPPPHNPALLKQPKHFEALPRSVTILGTAPVLSVAPAPAGWVFAIVLDS